MESAGDDVALKLLEQVADHLVEPSLKSAQEMDSSAAFVSISLRGVREVLLRLRHASVAKDNFSVVFPSRQRSSCIASVASSVEGAPEFILIEGPSPLYEDERLRTWSQRLWALLRLRRGDDDGSSGLDEGPVVMDMFLFDKEHCKVINNRKQ